MYDPAIGQFLSEDPLGFDAGDSSLRRYVGNSPWNATDPTGLQAQVLSGLDVWTINKDAATITLNILIDVTFADGVLKRTNGTPTTYKWSQTGKQAFLRDASREITDYFSKHGYVIEPVDDDCGTIPTFSPSKSRHQRNSRRKKSVTIHNHLGRGGESRHRATMDFRDKGHNTIPTR